MADSSFLISTAPASTLLAPVVQVQKATIVLGGRTIWQEVELAVQAGEFLAILGPNGAGKSTLLKAILGLLPLASGSIQIFGRPARRGNAHIGYVPQRRHFEADVHVCGRSIVELGLNGRNWGVPIPLLQLRQARETRRRVQDVIDLVGAAAYADRAIGELSGGEQQRLLIAQALVRQPRILALDEPLDSLDLRNQQGIASVIRHVSRETGAAILMVAHDINPILAAVDRVVYVAHGQVAIGTPEEIITSRTLSRLYATSIEVLHASDGRIVVVGQPEEEIHYHAAHHAR